MIDNSGFKWYTVQTYAGQESRSALYIQEFVDNGDLDGMISAVLDPSREIVSMKNGKRVSSQRRDFPGYILVEMDLSEESTKRQAMHFVQNVNGVMGFVGGLNPRPLKQAEVDHILGREVEVSSAEITEVPFAKGDSVKVTGGPFKDFDGFVEDLSPEKGKAKVLVSVFGRSTPVEVDFSQIEPVS